MSGWTLEAVKTTRSHWVLGFDWRVEHKCDFKIRHLLFTVDTYQLSSTIHIVLPATNDLINSSLLPLPPTSVPYYPLPGRWSARHTIRDQPDRGRKWEAVLRVPKHDTQPEQTARCCKPHPHLLQAPPPISFTSPLKFIFSLSIVKSPFLVSILLFTVSPLFSVERWAWQVQGAPEIRNKSRVSGSHR